MSNEVDSTNQESLRKGAKRKVSSPPWASSVSGLRKGPKGKKKTHKKTCVK